MSRKNIQPEALAAPVRGAHTLYSHVVSVEGKRLVFVAGQTGRHPATGEVGKDVREQTRNTLERIKVILAAAGTSLDNVLSAMTHLTRVQDLAAYNEEYAKYFPTDKPARTTVTVATLNSPELLIEITVIACIPD
jgi:enamine deaminase RidA (YjgF/YER057c/UK114 family)